MGYADNVPQTYLGSDFFGLVVPFEDWPSEIQQYYTYDPAKAEALLDEAGLARGTDGKRFRTTLLMRADSAGVTNDHALIAKEYWEAIGIEVEAEVIDTNIWRERVTKSKDWAGITPWRAAYDWDPLDQTIYQRRGMMQGNLDLATLERALGLVINLVYAYLDPRIRYR